MFQEMYKINVLLCTFVSSWALARLSTAMAKKTLSSVSVVELKRHQQSAGLSGGSNENMEGGDGALWENHCIRVFFTREKYHLNIYKLFLIVQDTVAKKCEDDEEDGEDHPFVIYSSLGLNAIVHHHVPVFSCQNLQSDIYISC